MIRSQVSQILDLTIKNHARILLSTCNLLLKQNMVKKVDHLLINFDMS